MFGIAAFAEAPFSALASFNNDLEQGARLDNVNTFYAASVVPGTVAIQPLRVENTNTFYAASIDATITLTQTARLDNTNAFYPVGLLSTYDLLPSRVDNSNAFYSAVIDATVTLAANRFDNANTFYAAAILPGAIVLSPALVVNVNTVYPPSAKASNDLQPPFLPSGVVFYAAKVKGGSPTPIPWNPGCSREAMVIKELPRQPMQLCC